MSNESTTDEDEVCESLDETSGLSEAEYQRIMTDLQLRKNVELRRNMKLRRLLHEAVSTMHEMAQREARLRAYNQRLTMVMKSALAQHMIASGRQADTPPGSPTSEEYSNDDDDGAHFQRSVEDAHTVADRSSPGSSNFVAEMLGETQPSSSSLPYVPVPVPAATRVPIPSFQSERVHTGHKEVEADSMYRYGTHATMCAMDDDIPLPWFVNEQSRREAAMSFEAAKFQRSFMPISFSV